MTSSITTLAAKKGNKKEYNKKSGKKNDFMTLLSFVQTSSSSCSDSFHSLFGRNFTYEGDAYDTTDLKGKGGSLLGASRDVTGTKSVPNELVPIGKKSYACRQKVLCP
jgi:hypothetical protein